MADVSNADPFPHTLTDGTVADADHVMANLNLLRNKLNGAGGVIATLNDIEATNLIAALAEQLGVSQGATVRRGKSIIATEESRTNAAYGLMPTPDQVSGVVVPPDGLLVVKYSALVKCSVVNSGRAAIFVGSTQLKYWQGNGAPAASTSPDFGATANDYDWLYTVAPVNRFSGLDTATQGAGQASRGADPLLVGGAIEIEVPAGTYDVSVQFLTFGGASVTAKERKLWVEARGF